MLNNNIGLALDYRSLELRDRRLLPGTSFVIEFAQLYKALEYGCRYRIFNLVSFVLTLLYLSILELRDGQLPPGTSFVIEFAPLYKTLARTLQVIIHGNSTSKNIFISGSNYLSILASKKYSLY